MKLNTLLQKIKFRLRYYKRGVFHFCGFCPKCNGRVNFTRSGKAVCPDYGN